MSEQEAKAESSVLQSSTSADNALDKRTLFVRSIPKDATSDELSEFFSQFVPVKHAVIVTDEEKNSRGFGFVSFPMDEDTLTALVEAKKNKFKGKLLRVDMAKRRDRKNAKSDAEAPSKPKAEPAEKRKARIIVRNLPWSCKDANTLRKIFQKYGAVHDAYIPTKKGGLMRGFAFVVMKKNAAAEEAVKKCKGLRIDGREVAVDLAVEKSKWEDLQESEPKETGRERISKLDQGSDGENEKLENGDESSEEENDSDDEFDKLNDVEGEVDDEVDDEQEEEEEEEEEKPKQNKQEAFSVFVRNIPYDADKDSLKEHFSLFGPVKYALPVMDRATGLAKGSAFVAFKTEEAYEACLANAPVASSTSMLISDDVAPEYVYEGRILSIASTVDRSSASRLADRNSLKRKEAQGKEPDAKDKRNLFLLNEGRITENSKLAQFVSKMDMELREKSYKLRVQQLNKNPTLHLSLTRLAVRNLPRSMNEKALKALGRKAVVEFATEVKAGVRQPLLKEEVSRSIKSKQENEAEKEEEEQKKKKNKKQGVVRQAKIIMEIKGSGESGRSRGYGFIEFRDHKAALMGLRWLNAHEITMAEIAEGLTDEEKKTVDAGDSTKRKLIVEFAVENAQVVKRRRERVMMARHGKRKRDEDGEEGENGDDKERSYKKQKKKGPSRKGNMNKGAKAQKDKAPDAAKASSMPDNVKRIIGRKRKDRKGKN